MTTPMVAVIGGGVAGTSAALAASAHGAETTLLDSSKRIGVSKALLPLLLSGGWTEGDLVFPEAGALAGAGVEALTGESVASIRCGGGKIRLETSSRRWASVEFDSVVVCTGATSQAQQLRGISKPNVFVLKGPADYILLSEGLDALQTVVVSGPIPLALKVGEILAARGKRAQVYCGKEGLERQFSTPVAAAIRRAASSGRKAGRVLLVDGPVDSILGVARAEAIVSSGSVSTCDAVVVIPASAPSFPLVDCKKGRGGGLLVDSSMSTSQPGVFAAGDSAEIKFKSGSVPARLHSTSRMGGEVAGTNAAGGRATAAPSWAVEQTYFGLEFCSAGLSEEEASAMGLEAATETATSRDVRFEKEERRETFVSMVYDKGTHQVYGLQVAGWRASSLSSAASLIVSLGVTVEQLLHVESPYSPGSSYEESPIALTAGKICNEEGA
ncbi:MAG TPA: FAD/NAD(P)-binding oxidoreductase [Nitrososphaerales archaeon]|nr:FAD/NAD(P)-binding oxidoreductase [Nitrososphaerales archaeon]